MQLKTLREELIKDISKSLENAYPITSKKITQIIVDSFDEYECENKIGVYAGNLFKKANAKKLGEAKQGSYIYNVNIKTYTP